MQLSFLAKSYTTAIPSIDTMKSEQTLFFLGRKSVVKQYSIAQRQTTGKELTFMGRRYSRRSPLAFLFCRNPGAAIMTPPTTPTHDTRSTPVGDPGADAEKPEPFG